MLVGIGTGRVTLGALASAGIPSMGGAGLLRLALGAGVTIAIGVRRRSDPRVEKHADIFTTDKCPTCKGAGEKEPEQPPTTPGQGGDPTTTE